MSDPQVLWQWCQVLLCVFNDHLYNIALAMQLDNFFHSQCMQSIEPNIPGNPRASLICSRQLMLLLLSLLRYSSPNILFTPFTKASKHLTTVLPPILRYSSTLLTGNSYANIRIAAMHFCKDERPSTKCIRSHLEIWIMVINSVYNSKEQLFSHSEPLSNWLSVYMLFSEK